MICNRRFWLVGWVRVTGLKKTSNTRAVCHMRRHITSQLRVHGVDASFHGRVFLGHPHLGVVQIRMTAEKLPHDLPVGLIRRTVPSVSGRISVHVNNQRPTLTYPRLSPALELLTSFPGIGVRQNDLFESIHDVVDSLA